MSLPLHYTPPVVVCTMCDDNLLHCHGTAIVTGNSHVCSDDPDCTLSINEHWFMSVEDEELLS